MFWSMNSSSQCWSRSEFRFTFWTSTFNSGMSKMLHCYYYYPGNQYTLFALLCLIIKYSILTMVSTPFYSFFWVFVDFCSSPATIPPIITSTTFSEQGQLLLQLNTYELRLGIFLGHKQLMSRLSRGSLRKETNHIQIVMTMDKNQQAFC